MQLPDDFKQAVYRMVDEMRGMATVGDHFGDNPYELDRAKHMMELAIQLANLVEEDFSPDEVRAIFQKRPWHRASPFLAADAMAFNPQGQLALIKRADTRLWALPGGLNEVGMTPAQTAVKELWEEAGLRGTASRLLGTFDAGMWGGRVRLHLLINVFLVECETFEARAGSECLDVAWFDPENLPTDLHPGHDRRIPEALKHLRAGTTHFDPASHQDMHLDNLQRPDDEDPHGDDGA